MIISKFKAQDQKQTETFFLRIYTEFGWDKRFIYGMENIAQTFGGEKEIFLTAKEKDKVVGCVGLKELESKTALMKRFYLAENYRGLGLGRKMFEKLLSFAREKGFKEIVLDTYQTNINAQRFYEKNGFVSFLPQALKKWPESYHPAIFKFYKLFL